MIRINKEKKRMPGEKEWEVLLKKEQRLLEKRKEKKETAFNRLLAEKVPEKLQHTLDIAFEKAFHLIFEKGTGIIEKTYGGHLEEVEHKIEGFMNNSSFPADYVPEEQISRTSRMLSRELLYMKFLQGIPVVGAVGGAYDAIYMKQIAVYAKLKYQKRFLIKYRK